MTRYQAWSEAQSSHAVHDIRASYAMPAAKAASSRVSALSFAQPYSALLRRDEDVALISVNAGGALHFYHALLQELKARTMEWQRAEEERWEQMAMELGVEKDIVFKTPDLPKRRITAKLRYRGRAIPKFYYEPVEDDE